MREILTPFPGSRHVSGLAAAMALRMFGLFVLLPVVAPHMESLPDGDAPVMIGLAVGVYGLTQAALQIPFGLFSDVVDRRMVIAFGLALFVSGGVIAHGAADAADLVVGRALQGAGAVSSAILAFTADLVQDQHRTKSMGLIGMAIGLAFAVAMVAGPPLAGLIGVPKLFLLTAALGACALVPVMMLPALAGQRQFPSFRRALGSLGLWKICAGIFCVHAALSAVFVVVPLELARDLDISGQWRVYLPAFLLSLAVAVPIAAKNDHKPYRAATQGAGVLILAAAMALLSPAIDAGTLGIGAFLFVFFCGFNAAEMIMPAEASRATPTAFRGTAMGIYTTCQFAGAFAGAMGGAFLLFRGGPEAIGLGGSIVLAAWVVVSFIRKERKVGHVGSE